MAEKKFELASYREAKETHTEVRKLMLTSEIQEIEEDPLQLFFLTEL